MTPKPQESRLHLGVKEVTSQIKGESIVISGMSGLFPMSGNVKDFSWILYNKVNPVTSEDNRWTLKHPELSEYTGKIPDIDRFDSQFFMVHNRLGNAMDPMARKALEQSYQAIYDAGLSPKQLSGKKIGVYVAAAFSDMENTGVIDTSTKTGYGITGISKTMYANRISYWLNAKGPSLTLDDACCGSMVALEEAYSAINRGTCEAAIVGGTNLCLAPQAQVHYNRCIKMSPDGKTKSFDQNADGCAKSEAICFLFLQKAKNALRAYAELVHVKNEFISRLSGETGQLFGFGRNPDTSASFMKQFYEEAGIPLQAVEYIEACGSATPEADKAELQAIEKVFCVDRTDPLLVGSVISNVGFSDAASGATAITKVLLGFHHSLLAGNLHYSTPRKDIPAIQDGRMSIVKEHQPFLGTYAAVNCLSVTGVNSHALLRGCVKPKDLSKYATSFPRLVTISSRQKDYIPSIFEDLKSRPIDAEEHALLHNIHSNNISGHLGRGYIILDTNEEQKTISLSEKMEFADETHRPLWFVYSGMGSQWAGMGKELMRIPIFAAAIERCHKVLEPKGIDIVQIITSDDTTTFDNVLNSFVGIAAIQIGLTDILAALDLHPDKIIGHSVGELGCAYADGCLSAEEVILSAYSRGKASNDTPLVRGAMAAVGLGYQQISKLCPPAIEIACHNSSSSCTISGPEVNISQFVATLTSNGIFAKEVPSANIAYHSRYIADAVLNTSQSVVALAGFSPLESDQLIESSMPAKNYINEDRTQSPNLLSLLSDIIHEPKARSERWLSTSVPEEKWDEPIAKYCSPEYLTNNLLSPVLFEETSRLIPSDAVLIEIAPHGLLQAILKRSLPESCLNIPFTQRGHKDNVLFLLEAIGKLYVEGYTPKVQAIYPKVEFPVSKGTPHLGHHVKWNHEESWFTSAQLVSSSTKVASFCSHLITTYDDEYSYLKGNVVQGNVLFPFAGALVAVWDTLAMTLGLPKKKQSVRFFDVHLYSQPILHNQRQLNLNVSLHRGNGRFEVLDGDYKVATGYVVVVETSKPFISKESPVNFTLSSNEIYQHLNSRGYSYRDEFRSIRASDESLTTAQIIWDNNWVTMIDGLFQLNDLRHTYDGVSQPSQIRELVIDVGKHFIEINANSVDGKTILRADVDNITDCTRCGGVSLHNLKFCNMLTSTPGTFKLITVNVTSKDVNNNKIQTPWENTTAGKNVALKIGNVGDLDELYWEEVPRPSESGVKVLVEYAGINTIDVKRATGVIPFGNDERYYGMDFSGTTESGVRVMGLVKNGAASTVVTALPELLWPVPAHWNSEEAATVPLAYLQAFYYLCVKNELQQGWKVLIHGAAGALGQAAVSVALAHGCHVFATVANSAKKRFLLRLFPELNEDMIGNSRDESFGDMVLNATNGAGCNIVVSCVREDLKNISLKCTAFSGVTIDMVQIQNRDEYEYGMFYMTKQRSYIAADFYTILDSGNQAELKKLQTLVSDGIARGFVRPLSRVTYAPHEVAHAFRLLASSQHRGRVLLRMQDSPTQTIPRIVCSPKRSHLIIWGGSSSGLALADRLIARGAKKLRIYCLQQTSYHLLKLRLWQKAGVDVDILHENITNSNDAAKVINDTNKLGPIEGIYVTTEGAIDSNKGNDVGNIIAQLDTASRNLCSDIKYFAVINVDNNIGLESCISRYKCGLPATMLSLPVLLKVNEKPASMNERSWKKSAADVTEIAIRAKLPVLKAQQQTPEQPYLIKLIDDNVGLDDDNCTFKDLGLVELQPIIKSFLRDVHVSMEDEEILMLTKKKLLEIQRNSSEQKLEEINGLQVFISYADADELRATTDLVPLKSLVSNGEMMQVLADKSTSHMFIIPGLEGHHERFRTLCERLKLPAFVLQPGFDRLEESPRELAQRYSKIILDQFKLKTKFYLLGYEFGVVTALELANILEDHGLTGTVYCLGDGPEEMKSLLELELSEFDTEERLQTGVVQHMSTLMAHGSRSVEESALSGCSSWQERVDACVVSLTGRVPHTAQYARGLLEATYVRINTARHYSAAPRTLRSRLVLLRARRDTRSEQCSLQRYSQNRVVVCDLTTPLPHATSDLQVPALINKYLDEDVLQTYEQCNLCETYMC